MKRVSVVIPNINGTGYLGRCLDSLREQSFQDFDIFMIDNGSSDGSVDYVLKNYPEVKIRAYHDNTGFCRAVNDGIRLSRSEYVLLLNNDTICDREMIRELVLAMDESEKRFSCAAKMISMRKPDLLDNAGDFYCALGWAFARGKGRSEKEYNQAEQVFSCCAAAAIYRRSLLLKIGLFDEKHFAYLEDIDVGYRARLAGYENWFIPSARVLHMGSATSKSAHNAFKVKLAAKNSVYIIMKNMPAWQILLNFPLLLAGFMIKSVYFSNKGLGREYVFGLKRGLFLCRRLREEKKITAGASASFLNCFKIQIMLWKNCLLRLADRGVVIKGE